MNRLQMADYIHGGTQKDHYGASEKEHCVCPLCGSNDSRNIDNERGLGIAECSQCQLIFTNPRAVDSDKNYFGDANVFYEEARLIFKGKKKHHRDRNYEYELKKIRRLKQSGRLLDVGPNMGFFIRKAKALGYDVEGVEPSPSLAAIAQREWDVNVHNSFLEEANLDEQSYDVITMIDVFEHVTNPSELLNVCHKLLVSDGVLAIKVPNGRYNMMKMNLAKRTKKHGKMDVWDAYEHVVHYTPRTFGMMAKKCGFNVEKFIIPKPIHTPIWANLVGHYYQYPSPFILDWKRIMLRNFFYFMGKFERLFGKKTRFSPDLFFLLRKT